jgi:hypothetical protein
MNALIQYHNIFFRLCYCRTFLLDSRMEKNNISSELKDFDSDIVFILHYKGIP